MILLRYHLPVHLLHVLLKYSGEKKRESEQERVTVTNRSNKKRKEKQGEKKKWEGKKEKKMLQSFEPDSNQRPMDSYGFR